MNWLYRHMKKILYDKDTFHKIGKVVRLNTESFGQDNKFEFSSKNIFGYSD